MKKSEERPSLLIVVSHLDNEQDPLLRRPDNVAVAQIVLVSHSMKMMDAHNRVETKRMSAQAAIKALFHFKAHLPRRITTRLGNQSFNLLQETMT